MEHNVCCEVAHVEVVELVAIELEVFFEAADIGITDVGLICIQSDEISLASPKCEGSIPRYFTKTVHMVSEQIKFGRQSRGFVLQHKQAKIRMDRSSLKSSFLSSFGYSAGYQLNISLMILKDVRLSLCFSSGPSACVWSDIVLITTALITTA